MNHKLLREVAPYRNTFLSENFPEKVTLPEELMASAPKISEEEAEVLKLAMETWAEYIDTEEGKAFNESMKTDEKLSKRKKKLLKIFLKRKFKKVIEKFEAVCKKLETIEPIYTKAGGFIPRSLSIAFTETEGTLNMGSTYTIGAAIGYKEGSKELETASFVSFGVSGGPEIGELNGVQLGIWRGAPDDIEGCYVSAGIEVNKVEDFSFSVVLAPTSIDASERLRHAFLHPIETRRNIKHITRDPLYWTKMHKEELIDYWNTHLCGFTITAAKKESTIGNFNAGWTYLFGENYYPGRRGTYLQPSYQSRVGKNYLIIIERVVCFNKLEAGADEVYFTFHPDSELTYFHPAYDYWSMDSNDTYGNWYCGRSVWCNDHVFVQLWNDDEGNHGNADGLRNCMIKVSDLTDLTPGQVRVYNMDSESDGHSNDNYDENLDKNDPGDRVWYQIDVRLVATPDDVDNSLPSLESVESKVKSKIKSKVIGLKQMI